MRITVSIIIPVCNEKENINRLYVLLRKALQNLPRGTEVIFVDDGSKDGSTEELVKVTGEGKKFKLIIFSKNYGKTAAISSGIKFSKGNTIVILDADLQNDPDDIPKLLDSIRAGYDVVSGWRKVRKDPFFTRRLPSIIANWLISVLTGVELHDYGCALKAYRREFLKDLALYGEMHRFLPAYCSWQGAKIAEIVVNHYPRKYGKSKYGLGRTHKVFLDLLVVKFILSYLTKPIYVFGSIAILSFIFGMIICLFVMIRKIFFSGIWLSPMFFIGVLLLSLGIICLFLGLIAEVISRLYFESRQYPVYRISKKINV